MKFTNHFLVVSAICCTSISFGQPNFSWAAQIGGAYYDNASANTLDASGNLIITGYFSGTADFNPDLDTFNLSNSGHRDIFISKFAPGGKFIWARGFGNTGYDQGYDIVADQHDNIYVTGSFELQVDFDPGPAIHYLTSSGGRDIFIAKFDPSGNLLWANKIGSGGEDEGYSLSLDTAGDVFVSGRFQYNVDFDPGPGTHTLQGAGSWDAFLIKLTNTGDFQWAKRIGASYPDQIVSITNDYNGNVYATGDFVGTVDFDPGSGTYELGSGGGLKLRSFLLKLDENGNFKWAKLFQSFSGVSGKCIGLDFNQNLYLTGYFGGTLDFDPDTTTTFFLTSITPAPDIFLLKVDTGGNFDWAVSFGGMDSDDGNSLTIDSSGNVYCTGAFNQTVDFDPGAGNQSITSAGYQDAFISKFDGQGNFQWVKTIGGSQQDIGFSIITDLAGSHLYTCGYFNQTVDFDPGPDSANLSSNGSNDIFIQLMTDCPLLNIDYSALNDSNTLKANQPNAVYQWLKCDSSFIAIAGETGSSYTPSVNGSYAVKVTVGACTDTSNCVVVNDIGIQEIIQQSTFEIFPNPNDGEFNIKVLDNSEIIIYNPLGKRIFEQSLSSGFHIISFTHPISGLYFVEVLQDNQRTIKRVAIAK